MSGCLSGPAFWQRLALAYRTALGAGYWRRSQCVGGRSLADVNRVSTLGNERSVVGEMRGVGLIGLSAFAVGRRLQVILCKGEKKANQFLAFHINIFKF